jgi:hypothetical protein
MVAQVTRAYTRIDLAVGVLFCVLLAAAFLWLLPLLRWGYASWGFDYATRGLIQLGIVAGIILAATVAGRLVWRQAVQSTMPEPDAVRRRNRAILIILGLITLAAVAYVTVPLAMAVESYKDTNTALPVVGLWLIAFTKTVTSLGLTLNPLLYLLLAGFLCFQLHRRIDLRVKLRVNTALAGILGSYTLLTIFIVQGTALYWCLRLPHQF